GGPDRRESACLGAGIGRRLSLPEQKLRQCRGNRLVGPEPLGRRLRPQEEGAARPLRGEGSEHPPLPDPGELRAGGLPCCNLSAREKHISGIIPSQGSWTHAVQQAALSS